MRKGGGIKCGVSVRVLFRAEPRFKKHGFLLTDSSGVSDARFSSTENAYSELVDSRML